MLNPPPVPELLAELAAFCELIERLLTGKDTLWAFRPAEAEWSLTEIACHLRDVEREVHLARLQALLADDEAFLPGVDADEWAVTRNYRAQDGRAAAVAFLAARDETVRLLSSLADADWGRTGQHTFFGPTSLREIVFLAVQHDRLHARQIEALIAAKPDLTGGGH
jgi:hypothetical protein